MTMRADSALASAESNRHSSTLAACSENRAKLTPAPSQVAPRGADFPGQIRMVDPLRLSADPANSQDLHQAVRIVNLELHRQRPFDENADVLIARFTLLV